MSGVLRHFANDDVGYAVERALYEGWDCTADTLRVFIEHGPRECFVAEVEGRRAGMITATCYGQSAWIGNLIVDPAHRRSGIGASLMIRAMRALEARGVGTVRLEADPMGIGIYRRLGFVDQFDSLRFRKEPPHPGRSLSAMRVADADLDDIKTLDRCCFRDDRGRLLEMLLGIAKGAYCVRLAGRLEGFAFALPSSVGVRLGPCVAENPTAAALLLESILADFPNAVLLAGVPSVNAQAVELFEAGGFTRTSPSLRMVYGNQEAESSPASLFAIANGAAG